MTVPVGVGETGSNGLGEIAQDRQRTSPIHPGTKPADGSRLGIKEASKTAPARTVKHGDLADKLQAKRSALSRFGIANFETQVNLNQEATSEGGEPTEGSTAERSHLLLDDDPDLHLTGNEE